MILCCSGWIERGDQQDPNRNGGREQKCGEIQMDDGQGKHLGQTDKRIVIHMGNIGTRKSLLVGLYHRQNIQE